VSRVFNGSFNRRAGLRLKLPLNHFEIFTVFVVQ